MGSLSSVKSVSGKKMSGQKHRKFPEIQKGIRIQFMDKNEATRSGKILARKGNTLTVIIGYRYVKILNKKYRISISNVIGYWNPKVKAIQKNLIRLKEVRKDGRRNTVP